MMGRPVSSSSSLAKTWVCRACCVEKHRSHFYERYGTHLYSYCKDCCKQKSKIAYANNKQRSKELNKAWVAANRDHLRAYKAAYLHGLSINDVKAVLAKGRCEICGARSNLCIDHCHKSGKIRGLLCHPCNKGLGFFRDDAVRLRSAHYYLNSRSSVPGE